MSAGTASPAILVVGSTMIDLIAYADALPEDGQTIVGRRFAMGFGGKGANQAVAAARLGARVAMVNCVGEDAYGEQTLDNFAAQGVDATFVRRVPGSSGVAPIWVDAAGRNRIICVPAANDETSPALALEAFDTVRPSVVVAQFETPQATTAAVFAAARAAGVTTVLNPAPAAPIDAAVLAATDWLVPNEHEFALIGGGALDGDAATEDARIAAFAASHGVSLLVTLGARGAAVLPLGGTVTRVTAPAVSAMDTTGAGDAFVGGVRGRPRGRLERDRRGAPGLRVRRRQRDPGGDPVVVRHPRGRGRDPRLGAALTVAARGSSPKPPPPPKPWRRESGSYVSADERFTIESGGAGRWFLTDGESLDELGLARTIGPFDTLDEAKAAAAGRREGRGPRRRRSRTGWPRRRIGRRRRPRREGDATPTKAAEAADEADEPRTGARTRARARTRAHLAGRARRDGQGRRPRRAPGVDALERLGIDDADGARPPGRPRAAAGDRRPASSAGRSRAALRERLDPAGLDPRRPRGDPRPDARPVGRRRRGPRGVRRRSSPPACSTRPWRWSHRREKADGAAADLPGWRLVERPGRARRRRSSGAAPDRDRRGRDRGLTGPDRNTGPRTLRRRGPRAP